MMRPYRRVLSGILHFKARVPQTVIDTPGSSIFETVYRSMLFNNQSR